MSQTWNVGERERDAFKRGWETAVLVAVITPDEDEQVVEEHLDELQFLALTAGAKTKKRITQKLTHPDPNSFVGKGKLNEIKNYVKEHDLDMVIFDDDLSASQIQTVEKKVKVKVVDRSTLILDIFAKRAKTAQAKTQVELAQMQYLLPRLRGMWTHLERQAGGIGARGPGEKEIETDRRIIRDKISKLKDELEKIDKQNATRRKHRGQMVRVALVGYTNVGKSTLMNELANSEVFAENRLFATLDTTVRKVVIERMPFLMSDTVGFLRKLPHHLIESFKSTLDEVRESDLILHVVDISHPQYEDQINTVRKTLHELGVDDKPTLMIFNKLDLYRKRYFDDYLDEQTRNELLAELKQNLRSRLSRDNVFISAKTGENIDVLKGKLQTLVAQQYRERYPYVVKHW